MINIYGVNKRLKQRPPFQMIEKVTELVPGQSATGVKTVSINDPWFVGHFPDAPMLPGVLIAETCAQLCSIVSEGDGTAEDKLNVLLKLDNFKFLKPVLPGDVMVVSVAKKSGAGPLVTFEATVTVDGQIRSKGNLSFTAIDRAGLDGENND